MMKNKKLTLSREEDVIVKKLTMDHLLSFEAIVEGKHFSALNDLVNIMIDMEKDVFFKSNDYEKDKLAIDHAYARGGIAMIAKVLRIMAAAAHEKDVRQNKE